MPERWVPERILRGHLAGAGLAADVARSGDGVLLTGPGLPGGPLVCRLDRRGPWGVMLDEPLAQAACGLMAVHGRGRGRRAARLGVDYVTTAAGVVLAQGVLASLLARLRGRAICGVTVSMAGTALLTVSQYLAASTADKPDLPARTDPGHPPPFRSADGVSFELETFSAQPWRLLWTSLGVPDTVADRAWQPFMLRYVSAVAPLPAALHLVAINPRLVSAHASGWGDALGADPPPGTDFMVQAYAGLPDHLTPADEAPAGSLMTLLDVLGGLIATSGVLAGLLGRERDGRGAGCQLPAVRRRPAASPAKRTGTTRTARVQDVRSTAARGGRRPRAQPKRLAARSHRRTRSMPGDDRFLVPLYSAVEAARHLDVPASTFRTWAHGYRNRPRGRPPVVGESIVTTVPADSGASIPFVGLAATPPRRGALGNSSSCATTNESSPR